jgi:hypothetical protein
MHRLFPFYSPASWVAMATHMAMAKRNLAGVLIVSPLVLFYFWGVGEQVLYPVP